MVNETKLVQKVKHLVRRAGLPRWLHRFGPKKYLFQQHLLSLLLRELFQLSYRRSVKILTMLGISCASKSTLQYTARRMPAQIWQRLLAATHHSLNVCVAAVDGTGFARTSRSVYYTRRIGGTFAKRFVKVSILVDTRRKKVLAASVRMLPAHDVRDVPALLKKQHIKTLVADKGYDSEAIHELCNDQGTISMIPCRRTSKKGFYRHKMSKRFRLRTYHRREIVESMFSSIKRLYGSTVRCCRARTVRSQIFSRLILQNIILRTPNDLGQSLKNSQIYKPPLHFCTYQPESTSWAREG